MQKILGIKKILKINKLNYVNSIDHSWFSDQHFWFVCVDARG